MDSTPTSLNMARTKERSHFLPQLNLKQSSHELTNKQIRHKNNKHNFLLNIRQNKIPAHAHPSHAPKLYTSHTPIYLINTEIGFLYPAWLTSESGQFVQEQQVLCFSAELLLIYSLPVCLVASSLHPQPHRQSADGRSSGRTQLTVACDQCCWTAPPNSTLPTTAVPTHRTNWRQSLQSRYNRHYVGITRHNAVKLNGKDFSCYSNKIEWVSLRKCPYDHWLTNKAYSSAITVTNISQSFFCLEDGSKNQLA